MTADSMPTLNVPRSLLNGIRKRPPMYLGTMSLTRLSAFVQGYRHALFCHSIQSDCGLDIPQEIHDWVAYRLHFRESTRGYANMILERSNDEAAALQRFFHLLDEYDQRIPKVVAKLNSFEKKCHRGLGEPRQQMFYPSTIVLVTYTDDPGFFVEAENADNAFPSKGFCPSLRSFELRFAKRSSLEILDRDTYDRLIREDASAESK
jgi:hypothetical protein